MLIAKENNRPNMKTFFLVGRKNGYHSYSITKLLEVKGKDTLDAIKNLKDARVANGRETGSPFLLVTPEKYDYAVKKCKNSLNLDLGMFLEDTCEAQYLKGTGYSSSLPRDISNPSSWKINR